MHSLIKAQQAANQYFEIIENLQTGLQIHRNKIIAAALYHTALDHCYSVSYLISNQRHASAAALIRPAREAYIRGCWINHSNDVEKIARVWHKGEDFPQSNKMHTSIQSALSARPNLLLLFNLIYEAKGLNHKTLNDLTHNGPEQILNRLPVSSGKIESEFSSHNLLVFLESILTIALAATYEIIEIASPNDKAERLNALISAHASALIKINNKAKIQLFIE